MKRSNLKSLIKLIILETLNPPTTKLLDNWKQVSTVKNGRMAGTRGYFIMKNGKFTNASVEMEGSTGLGGGVDHYGYALALDNRKLFGIPDDIAKKALEDDEDVYIKVWGFIENAISARVMTLVNSYVTHRPDITVEVYGPHSPKSALRLVQGWVGKQIPDSPENSSVTIDLRSNHKSYVADSIEEFLSVNNPQDLKQF